MSNEYNEYLGDGVYAAYDGYDVTLTTENGIETTNSIILEPHVLAALNRYIKTTEEKFGVKLS